MTKPDIVFDARVSKGVFGNIVLKHPIKKSFGFAEELMVFMNTKSIKGIKHLNNKDNIRIHIFIKSATCKRCGKNNLKHYKNYCDSCYNYHTRKRLQK